MFFSLGVQFENEHRKSSIYGSIPLTLSTGVMTRLLAHQNIEIKPILT